MHTNMLTLNGQKMAKSTGNNILPNEIFTGENDKLKKPFSPSVTRFFMMQAHYRSVLDFSNDALLASEKGFFRLADAIKKLEDLKPGFETEGLDVTLWKAKCYDAMSDDLNTPVLIAHLFDAVKYINALADGKADISESSLIDLRESMNAFFYDVLGLL